LGGDHFRSPMIAKKKVYVAEEKRNQKRGIDWWREKKGSLRKFEPWWGTGKNKGEGSKR